MPLSGPGRKAEGPASAPSRASEHGELAEQAVEEEQEVGWAGGLEQGHSVAESSPVFGVESEPPPPEAVQTARKGGLRRGHWLGAAE